MLNFFKPSRCFTEILDETVIKTIMIDAEELEKFLLDSDDMVKNLVTISGFKAEKDQFLIIPDDFGKIRFILAGYCRNNIKSILYLAHKLPEHIKAVALHALPETFCFSLLAELWGAESYVFDKYKSHDKRILKLFLGSDSPKASIYHAVRALYLGRDAVNLPAEDCTPQFLQDICEGLANEFHASCETIIGSDLLDKNFNLIHAVGRAVADRERLPRLIDLKYYLNPTYPRITLVGKGVCFDSGGLHIKTGSSMNLMKKDMGGAACVMALALRIMAEKLPINLRVLIPAVENNISANAFRAGDIYTSYNGKTIEITNTDAEGRLILADALSFASQDSPDLLLDMATLTGAARVAVGAELPALFTNSDEIAREIEGAGKEQSDPSWRLPLYATLWG